MRAFRQQRAWYWIAIAAIVIALVALLVPHGHATNAPAWIALLPVFFVGLLVPFNLLPLLLVLSLGHAPQAPSLAPSFQRPPPFRLA
jgi:cell division protein FtsW (lipid II flippase)